MLRSKEEGKYCAAPFRIFKIDKTDQNELRENPVWLRLVRMNKIRGKDGEDGRSRRANLGKVGSQTGRVMRLAEHTVTDLLSRTHISAHSTDDITRQKDGDEGQAKHTGTQRLIRQSVVERGLVNHALGDTPSLASTSASSADCVKRKQ